MVRAICKKRKDCARPRKVTIAECTSMIEARTDECCARDAVSAYIALIHKLRRSSLCHIQRHITRAVHRIWLRSKKEKKKKNKEEEEGLERKYNDIPPASEQGRKEYLPEVTNCERDRR